MEARFRHDFSRVRIHTDSKAAESARAVNAQAYTVNQDIAFLDGGYAPDTTPGRKLLAHELTHVVQQSRGGVAAPLQPRGSGLERSADNAAAAIAAGRDPVCVTEGAVPGLARQQLFEREPRSLHGSLYLPGLTPEALAQEIELIKEWLKDHLADPQADHLRAELHKMEMVVFQRDEQRKAERWKKGLQKYARLEAQTGHGLEADDRSFIRFMMKPNHQLGFSEPGFTYEEVQKLSAEYWAAKMKATEPSPEKRAANAAIPFVPPEPAYAEQLEDGRVYYDAPIAAIRKERGFAVGNVVRQKIQGVVNSGPHSLAGRVVGAITAAATGRDVQAGGEMGAAIGGVGDIALSFKAPQVARSRTSSSGGGTSYRPDISPPPSHVAKAPVRQPLPTPGPIARSPSPAPPPASPRAPDVSSNALVPATSTITFNPTGHGSPSPTGSTVTPPAVGGGGEGQRPRRDTIVSHPPPPPARPPPTQQNPNAPQQGGQAGLVWDLHGNPIPPSQLAQSASPAGPDRVFVVPGSGGASAQVHVVRGGKVHTFAETNRTLAEQQKRGYLTERPAGNVLSLEEMQGKKVLDLAAGTQGRTVRELQDRKIDASGMDIALSEQAAKTSGLRRADLATTVPFKEKFDIAYELYGGLGYGLGPQTGPAFQNAISRLKPGGTLYLAPLSKNAQADLLPFVQEVVKRGGKLSRTPFHGEDEVWRLVMPSE